MGFQERYSVLKIFNPEGRIKQLDFIQQTVEFGSTVVGLRNKSIGVLVAHNERVSKLADGHKKVFQIDERTLFTFSGITNDGLCIVDYLIDKNIRESVVKERKPHFLGVFDDMLIDVFERTVLSGRRLCGASGLYLTDYNGAIKLVEFNPEGWVKEVVGMGIGYHSQSSKTILEAYFNEYERMGLEELVKIGVMALKNAHPENMVLNKDNVEIWVLEVGKGIYPVEGSRFV